MRLGLRRAGLVRPPGNGRIRVRTRFDPCRGDEIGKHSGLKIRRFTACRFESGPRHQIPSNRFQQFTTQPRRITVSGVFVCYGLQWFTTDNNPHQGVISGVLVYRAHSERKTTPQQSRETQGVNTALSDVTIRNAKPGEKSRSCMTAAACCCLSLSRAVCLNSAAR